MTSQPAMINFGRVVVGSTLAGSFQVLGARSCTAVECHWEESGRPLAMEPSMPAWLHVTGPWETGQEGLGWRFRLDASVPHYRSASLRLICDAGTATVELAADIRDATPALGDLAICDEPFDCTTDLGSVMSLARLFEGLDVRTHHLGSLSALGAGTVPAVPHTLLLHGSGLKDAAKRHLATVHALPDAGTNVVILANKFFHGTTDAANRILEPWGIAFVKGTEQGARSAEELPRRNLKLCGMSHTQPHPLTAGVRRTRWYRSWPIACRPAGGRVAAPAAAVPLIIDPSDPKRCLVAAAKPNGYAVAVGEALHGSLSANGWPYDNDRLLANLLAGGDAES